MVKTRIKKEGQTFPRWFDNIVEQAEIYDYGRYPVKGCGVWLPYGFKIRKYVIEVMRKLLDETGHEEILMPLLIPEDLLSKEKEHIEGFRGEVYWVTKGGQEDLDVKLALRPTSETVISLYESYWFKSYKQLPKKLYQVVSIFRYETKATRPMIRVREVTTFKEAHTLHESFESAEKQVIEAVNIYRKFFETLGIPFIVSKRPDWDKFAGALYTIAFDTVMPDGKVLQIGTVHNLGQNFTKVFEVRIQLADETVDYGWQTSYGISERVIAALISIHGDDLGLILPPKFAPIQVIVIPIFIPEIKKEVLNYAEKIVESLRKEGIRVEIDAREDVTPGYKFYDWEMRGVPLRLEIGRREVKGNTVTLVDRVDKIRKTVKLEHLVNEVLNAMVIVEDKLRKRAWNWFKDKVREARSVDEAKNILKKNRGIVELPWCGNEECGLRLEELLEAKTLGSPVGFLEKVEAEGMKCPVCGREAKTKIRLAKTY